MPRTYTKQAGSKYGDYDREQMKQAVEAVRDGMPKFTAARTFGVERTSLIRHCQRAEQNLVVSPQGPVFRSDLRYQLNIKFNACASNADMKNNVGFSKINVPIKLHF